MVVAALWITGFWVFKKDPYLDIFVLLAVVGTFSLLIVQTITMAAVFTYFRKHHPGENPWRVKVAPVAGGVGMLAVVVLMIQNLDTAAGSAAHSLLFKMIPYIAITLFCTGAAMALYLKRADPEKYQLIGRVVLAVDASGPVYDADGEGDGPAESTADRDELTVKEPN